jgi:hypothetical protein
MDVLKLEDRLVVYLVESAKGLVSIMCPPILGEKTVVVLLGCMAESGVAFNFETTVFSCKTYEKNEISVCRDKIVEYLRGRKLIVIATDDTFNAISFSIVKSLSDFDPYNILYDHLKFDNLGYRNTGNIVPYIRFRNYLFCFFSAFVPIRFSNGIFGYKLEINFQREIVFDGAGTNEGLKDSFDSRLIILIPPSFVKQYDQFMAYMENMLESIKDQPELHKKIAIKLHPRYTKVDENKLEHYRLLAKCSQLIHKLPIEFYTLKGIAVINFNSSFGNQQNTDVYLLCRHFGYSDLLSSNMTGNIDFEIHEFPQLFRQIMRDKR